MARLTFYGAAETVTGSKYLLEAAGKRLMVDCGLFQGLKRLRLLNWEKLPFDPQSVAAVVLTHAHIDHIGYLPRFVKSGYRGPVYCTPATADLAEIMLLDAAKIQEADAQYANKKHFSKHHPALPLFETEDAVRAVKLIRSVNRDSWFDPAPPFRCQFHDAGHLLGSAMIEIEVADGGSQPMRMLFSGDVGRYNAPVYHNPSPPPACDYLICESTYGDREHLPVNLLDELERVVNLAVRRGGVLLVAAFAVGRAQQLIYLLQLLAHQGRTPAIPIYLDSPMAIDATTIYSAYRRDHDLSEGELEGSDSAFHGPNVHLVRTMQESKGLNNLSGPAVIIASSGMMTSGRILHHLEQRLPDSRNTVLLAGFMAEGTRGRALEEGAQRLRMHGRDVPVRAAIEKIAALSCHADRSELMRWLELMPPPRQTFLTHGEPHSAKALAELLRNERGWNVKIPKLGEEVALEAIH